MKSRLSPAVQLSSCRVLSAASRAPLARAAQRTCGAHRTSGRAAGLLSCCRKYRRCIVLKSRCRSYSMSSTFISCARIYLNCFFLIVWTITLRQKYASVWQPRHIFQPRSRAKRYNRSLWPYRGIFFNREAEQSIFFKREAELCTFESYQSSLISSTTRERPKWLTEAYFQSRSRSLQRNTTETFKCMQFKQRLLCNHVSSWSVHRCVATCSLRSGSAS